MVLRTLKHEARWAHGNLLVHTQETSLEKRKTE